MRTSVPNSLQQNHLPFSLSPCDGSTLYNRVNTVSPSHDFLFFFPPFPKQLYRGRTGWWEPERQGALPETGTGMVEGAAPARTGHCQKEGNLSLPEPCSVPGALGSFSLPRGSTGKPIR